MTRLRVRSSISGVVLGAAGLAAAIAAGFAGLPPAAAVPGQAAAATAKSNAEALIDEGRRTFRHDTFGDEAFWGGRLRLHQAIEGEKLGGVGPGVSPRPRSPSA